MAFQCKPEAHKGGSMAGVTGLEPAASGVTGRRSNQLSYTPLKRLKAREGAYIPQLQVINKGEMGGVCLTLQCLMRAVEGCLAPRFKRIHKFG